MIRWYVQMDVLGNFWLNAEVGKAPDIIRAVELIPRKVWSGPGDRQQVLVHYITKAKETIKQYQRLAAAC